jgi:alpha-amylase
MTTVSNKRRLGCEPKVNHSNKIKRAGTAGLFCLASMACLPTREVSRVQFDSSNPTEVVDPFLANAPGRAMVHLFEWRWSDIATECETVLGPAGIYSVQISPPTEHRNLVSSPWWQRYQPVSYRLESRSGSEQDFRDMILRCARSGVGITVDAVVNHMTGGVAGDRSPGRGFAGTPYSKYEYNGLYSTDHFHGCLGSKGRWIQNYSSVEEVRECELVGLADLKTSDPHVRSTLGEFLDRVASLGIHGFRIDAAKHMSPADVADVLNRTKKLPNTFLEVIGAPGEAVNVFQYDSIARVTEFRFSSAIADAVRKGRFASFMEDLGSSGWLASDKALVFVDNHDNQRGHGSGGQPLTHKEPQHYELANVLMLALPYGQPSIMSSYTFNDGDQGPPSASDGTTLSPGPAQRDLTRCANGWVCEHRQLAIRGMVGFRNASAGAELQNLITDNDGFVSFSRGSTGWLAMHQRPSGNDLTKTLFTALPSGRYCDVVTGGLSPDGLRCQGRQIKVDQGGQTTLTLANGTAVAIHAQSRLP